jgi:hypothetical protein
MIVDDWTFDVVIPEGCLMVWGEAEERYISEIDHIWSDCPVGCVETWDDKLEV